MKLVYLLYGFPEDFINDCILRFYKKFHASEVHYLVDRVPYAILRHRVSEYYQQIILLKKRWSTEIETIQCLSYSFNSDTLMLISFKRQFMDLLNKYITFLPDFNEPMNDVALTMNEHHRNQKPSRLLLAFPESVRTKKTIVCITPLTVEFLFDFMQWFPCCSRRPTNRKMCSYCSRTTHRTIEYLKFSILFLYTSKEAFICLF